MQQVETGGAVDIDADVQKLRRGQSRGNPNGLLSRFGQACRRRYVGPMGRTQATYPSAFLVHQHWCVAVDALPHLVDEGAKLIGGIDITREDNEAVRLNLTEEAALPVGEAQALAAEDDGSGRCHPRLPG